MHELPRAADKARVHKHNQTKPSICQQAFVEAAAAQQPQAAAMGMLSAALAAALAAALVALAVLPEAAEDAALAALEACSTGLQAEMAGAPAEGLAAEIEAAVQVAVVVSEAGAVAGMADLAEAAVALVAVAAVVAGVAVAAEVAPQASQVGIAGSVAAAASVGTVFVVVLGVETVAADQVEQVEQAECVELAEVAPLEAHQPAELLRAAKAVQEASEQRVAAMAPEVLRHSMMPANRQISSPGALGAETFITWVPILLLFLPSCTPRDKLPVWGVVWSDKNGMLPKRVSQAKKLEEGLLGFAFVYASKQRDTMMTV